METQRALWIHAVSEVRPQNALNNLKLQKQFRRPLKRLQSQSMAGLTDLLLSFAALIWVSNQASCKVFSNFISAVLFAKKDIFFQVLSPGTALDLQGRPS